MVACSGMEQPIPNILERCHLRQMKCSYHRTRKKTNSENKALCVMYVLYSLWNCLLSHVSVFIHHAFQHAIHVPLYVSCVLSSKLPGLKCLRRQSSHHKISDFVPYCPKNIRSYQLEKICILLIMLSRLLVSAADSAPQFRVQPSFLGGVVTEHQSRFLQCQAVGDPPPEYQWLLDGKPLTNFSRDPLLRISDITKNKSGNYQCIARNKAGTIFSQKTSLTVAYMESSTDVEDITLSIASGAEAVLHPPLVHSMPPATVTWQKVNQGILHGIHYAVSLSNALVILDAQKEHEGQYQASLLNIQAGQEVPGNVIHLEISGEETSDKVPPKIVIPPQNSLFKQGDNTAILECISNSRPLEDLHTIWKKDGKNIETTGLPHSLLNWNRTLSLDNIGPDHEGEYECTVTLSGADFNSEQAFANVTVMSKPTIVQGPERETISELGRVVLLPCTSIGNPTPDITWYRNADLIEPDFNHRFHILSNGTLQILELYSSDVGIYQCMARNEAGDASSSTWLHVKTSAPLFIKQPQNVTVLVGKDAQIVCEASGAPAPNVSWVYNDEIDVYSEGRTQIFDNGNLLIASVEPDDVGKYTCVRANNAGTTTGSAYLSVLVRTQILQPPVNTRVILSNTAELQCKVSHDPTVPFTIQWFFGSKEILPHSGGRIQILPDGSLQIGQARNTDVGLYTCQVTSAGGNETRSARLDVIELPHPPSSVEAVLLDTTPKSVNVSWSRSFDGNSPITNYIVQMRIVPPDTQMEHLLPWMTALSNVSGSLRYAVLTNLKPSSDYEFRVSAVNGVGEGNPSSPTGVIHLPSEPPSGPPLGVVGGARSPTSIMLQWQSPSDEDRNGKISGYSVRYKLAKYIGSPWVTHNITNEAQHSFVLQDLIVWQNYEIQVAAYNEKGIGVYSDSIYVRTKQGTPQLAPTDVRADAVSSTSIKVWWKPPDQQFINGINLGYKVQAWLPENYSNGSPALTILIAPSTLDPEAEQNTVITGLSKFTTYYITVLCFTSPGDGPVSDPPVTVTTKQDVPDKVSFLKFEDILDTSVKVIWGQPVPVNGVLKGYTLRYHIKDATETTVVRNITAEATSVVVTDLRPVTAYTFEIFPWTVVGPGPSRTATIQSGIPPVLPGLPSKLAVSNIGAFSVVLQFIPGFDGNSSIIKWTIEAQTRRNDSWVKIYEISDPEATNVHVHNLVPFTEYRLRISATNVVGSSEFSEPSKFFQTIQAPPSHPPYNVTVRAMSETSLRVRWTPLHQVEWYGIPRGYNILYKPVLVDDDGNMSENYTTVVLEDHNANSYIIKELEEFTDFEILVQAFNDVGTSALSPRAIEKTRESSPSAGPQNVKISATSSTTIVVTWEEVEKIHQNGIIDGYKVCYAAKMVPMKCKDIDNNNTFTTTLTELRKYTVYSVQVLAFTRVGDGVLSIPPASVRTFEDVPGAPSNVTFPDVTTTTARILWDMPTEPNGEILWFRLSYGLNGSTEPPKMEKLEPTERTYKAVNLFPEMYYLFSLAAQTNEGWGKSADVLVYTTNNRESPQPPTVPHISQSQIQARQITFSWTPGRDGFAPLRFYTVQFAEGDDSPWKTLPFKIDPLVTTYTVTDLKPFTLYKFRIRATNDIGASGWSPESNVTRTRSAAPEHAPKHVVVTPYTTTSIRVNWVALNPSDWNGESQSAGYRVEYCKVTSYMVTRNGDCPSGKVLGSSYTSLSLENLEKDTMYEVKVYAFNKEGDGPPSKLVQVVVGEAVPTGGPRNVKVEAKSSTEINVHWEPPPQDLQNGDLLGYKIFYEPINGMVAEEREAVPPSTTSYTLIDLKKYTNYSIQIVAFNPTGDGPRSSMVYARTMADIPGMPGPLHFTDITMTSLNVSWTPPAEPNGEISGYLVTYETTPSERNFSKQVIQQVTTTYLSVHGLGEAVTYVFRVRAETFNYGPESVKSVRTGPQPGSPSSPEDLILSHTHTSVMLQWKNGAEGFTPIIGYLIEFRQSGGNEPWQTLVLLNNGVQTSYSIDFSKFLPSTSYQFRLFARNSNGISYPANSPQTFATPSKLFQESRHKLAFYREEWFVVMLAAVSIIVIILVVAVLCVKSKVYKYKKESQKPYEDHMSMDDGGFATFELCQSKRGTLCRNTLSRKNNNTMLTKSPPRPSPGSVTYSDDDDVKGYDENCDSSSLTEKPSEISSSDSQGSDSERESDDKFDPHSFVNHYANVNDTLRQSWKRQKPVKPPSYTDSEPEGSIQVSLNGGQIVMNNMAGSRAPLPGFSSFV